MALSTLKIDEVYETEITGLENEGNGVCKIKGMVVFVPKTLIGEKVKVRIIEIKKNYARAKLIKILKKSENRIESKCPYYEECGGCNLRHQINNKNLEFKVNKVKTALEKVGKINTKVYDIIPSNKNDNYRNKASFKIENNKIGFYAEGTYRLIDIDYCLLLENEINECLRIIRTYLINNQNNIKAITIKKGNALGDLLIDIYSTDDNDAGIINYLINNESKIKTIIFNDKVLYGDGYIKQITNGFMFNCSSKSFFQVNNMQAEKLYSVAVSAANLSKEDTVLDLYSGTGTIASIISSYVKKVIGIEIVPDAVNDAKNNLEINNINNVSFICGDASKEIAKIKDKIDVIFVDPPRKGLDKLGINIMKKMRPKKIIYISCNPVTMARDLNYLNDTYDVKKVIPVDMFPNTSHCESITVLERRQL